MSRRAAINLLRALADGGLGEFKVGRKGHPSRFEWAEDPQALAERVGQLADGDGRDHESELEHGELKDRERPGELFATTEPFSPLEATSEGLIEHSYVLRPKLRIVLRLPEDLSTREAEVLSEWIRNLSFER